LDFWGVFGIKCGAGRHDTHETACVRAAGLTLSLIQQQPMAT
jgi:hypothetical protein